MPADVGAPVRVQRLNVAAGQKRHCGIQLVFGPLPPPQLEQKIDQIFSKPPADLLCGMPADDGIGRDIPCHHGARSDHGAIADRDARHNNGFGADPYVISDDRIAGGLEAVLSITECGHVRHPIEWERADPVVSMALVSRHDEAGAGTDRAEAPNQQAINALIWQKIAGAFVEALAMVVAGVVAEPPDQDVRICDLFVQGDSPKRALEVILHFKPLNEWLACAHASASLPPMAARNLPELLLRKLFRWFGAQPSSGLQPFKIYLKIMLQLEGASRVIGSYVPQRGHSPIDLAAACTNVRFREPALQHLTASSGRYGPTDTNSADRKDG